MSRALEQTKDEIGTSDPQAERAYVGSPSMDGARV